MRPDINAVFSQDNLTAMSLVFGEANNLRRWTDFASDSRYDELAKQALNCATAFMILKHWEHEGKKVDYTKIPKIALGRVFAKVCIYYDTPEHKIHDICEIGGFTKETLDRVAKEQIAKKTNQEFAEFVSEDRNSDEVLIYKAATKIATLLEFTELTKHYGSMNQKMSQICGELQGYEHIPGVREVSDMAGAEFQILEQIAKLRNANRWATRYYLVACSVLGHLFDTACYGYALSLLRGESEEDATKMFFIGIFHDIAEIWTKDIPSPVKKMLPPIRDATEEYERRMLEEYVYSNVPVWLADAIKSVSMEEKANDSLKVKAKEADYLSADSECVRNLMAGSMDWYLVNAITDKRVFVTKEAELLHERFERYALECAKRMPNL